MKDRRFSFDGHQTSGHSQGQNRDKHKVNLLFKTLMQVDYVVLLELAEHLNLTHRGLLHDLIVVRLLEFLNSN